MKIFNKFYSIVLSMAIFGLICESHAMEVVPDIGFRQYQAANGSEFDPKGTYRTPMSAQGRLNDSVLPDSHLSKMVPGFNSLGLNFTFQLD